MVEKTGLGNSRGEVGGIGQGENLSPTYAPEMIIPAVRAGLMPRPAPMPRNARPMVAVVVQEEPHAIPTIAQRMQPTGRNSFGVSRSRP